MKLSWFGTAWAALKGALSFGSTARLSIVDYICDTAYAWYSNVDTIMANIKRTYTSLVTICDKLDYYAKYIPTPWIGYYSNICDGLKALRDTLADGKVERTEVERLVEIIKVAFAAWNK